MKNYYNFQTQRSKYIKKTEFHNNRTYFVEVEIRTSKLNNSKSNVAKNFSIAYFCLSVDYKPEPIIKGSKFSMVGSSGYNSVKRQPHRLTPIYSLSTSYEEFEYVVESRKFFPLSLHSHLYF